MTAKLRIPEDIVGKKFGHLTVTAFVRSAPYRYGRNRLKKRWNHYYVCACDCGNTVETQRTYLLSGTVKSCHCAWKPRADKNWKWTGHQQISGTYLGRLRRGAECRGISFLVTDAYLWDCFQGQLGHCALSGVELRLGGKQTASVDRIDSSKGYVNGNVQWVHKDLNRVKLDIPNEQFVAWCLIVADYQRQVNPAARAALKKALFGEDEVAALREALEAARGEIARMAADGGGFSCDVVDEIDAALAAAGTTT